MNFDFTDFKNFFTVKHITVVLFVAACLFLICSPHSDNSSVVAQTCSDASCPYPKVDGGATLSVTVLTSVSDENWSINLVGEGWERMEGSRSEFKMVQRNADQQCMVLLIKEPTGHMSFGQYILESIKGFSEGGAQVTAIKQVSLNEQKFVLMESHVEGSDVLMAWNGIKDGFGYSLSCFYHPDVDAGSTQHDLCVEIAESLQIK